MDKKRRNFSAQEKTAILREHLINKIPVSDLCDQHGIHPTLFYRWQKTIFENMHSLFETKQDPEAIKLRRQNELLQEKLTNKDKVIAQIMEEYVAVKKSLGEV
jgi:transposase